MNGEVYQGEKYMTIQYMTIQEMVKSREWNQELYDVLSHKHGHDIQRVIKFWIHPLFAENNLMEISAMGTLISKITQDILVLLMQDYNTKQTVNEEVKE